MEEDFPILLETTAISPAMINILLVHSQVVYRFRIK